jgi:hypothetical protein
MSTILKALKKAEDGRAKTILQERLVAEEPPASSVRRRAAVALAAVLLAAAVVVAAMQLRLRRFAADVTARPAAPRGAPSSPPRALPGGEAPATPSLRLSGVIWDEETPLAIVNGRPVAVGEELSGVRVVGITVDGATFRRGTEEFALTVEE